MCLCGSARHPPPIAPLPSQRACVRALVSACTIARACSGELGVKIVSSSSSDSLASSRVPLSTYSRRPVDCSIAIWLKRSFPRFLCR